ncbi:MAG: hypothetical protein ACR2NY_04105 [Alphaproteobacteria bacterium]
MASWRGTLYSLEKKHYPIYFQKFLAKQKTLLVLLALPIVQIPWIFILLFALRHAMLKHSKKHKTKYNFLFFHVGIITMLLQFFGFEMVRRADNHHDKWSAILIELFILWLAIWQWLLVHRVPHQLQKYL